MKIYGVCGVLFILLGVAAGYCLAVPMLILTSVFYVAAGLVVWLRQWDVYHQNNPEEDSMIWIFFFCTIAALLLMWGTYYFASGQTWLEDFFRHPGSLKVLR